MSGLIGLSALADDARAAIRGGGSDRLGLTPTGVKTANYTAAAGDFVPVDTTAGNVTVTLPTAPADGTVVAVKHVVQGGTNTVSLALGGSDHFNTVSGANVGALTLLNQGVVAQYVASLAVWYVVADDLPLSGLNGTYVQAAIVPAPSGGDDTAAIQAVINASALGADVVFRTGTYLISAPIRFKGGRRYVGAGHGYGASGTTIKQKDGANITNSASLTGLFVADEWYTNASGCGAPVRIENLYLDGNKANNASSTACGIILMNYWSLIQDVQVANVPKHGIHLTDIGADGSTQILNSASENRIYRCRIAGPGGHGISQLSANTISNQDGFCVDNLITATGQDGINFQRGSGWVFRRNHMYGVQGNGIVSNNSFCTVITDNEIEDFGAAAVASTFYAGISVTQLNGRGTTVRGNYVGCTEPAGTSLTFQYVIVTAGVSQTDAQAVVTDNLIHGPTGGGTSAGRAVVITNNGSGGTAGILTAVVDNNRVQNVNTEVFVGTGNVVTGRTYGAKTIDGATTVGGLFQFKAHETSGGNPTTTITAGGQATTAATSGSLAANDAAGQITATTVASPVAGGLATVTFGTAYAAVPRSVVITPANAAAAACQAYVSSQTASAFVISCAAAPSASTALLFNYRVTG